MNEVDLARAESPLVLALDAGTSSCRASLYDRQARRVARLEAQLTYDPRTTPDGGAELDPDQLVEMVLEAIDRLAACRPSALDEVRAVAVSTFWHSLLGVDEHGRAVTPLLLWLDARSGAEVGWLRERLDERAVHARTGCVLHWSYWPAKLRWLRRTHPDAFRRVARFVSFGEYLELRLFGRADVSISMASGTGLFNHHTADWDDELLAELPVEPERLSSIVAGGAADASMPGRSSLVAERWPSLARVPWLPASGDGACSNLGAGCATRERRAVMVGTSGALRVLWSASDVTIPWGAWCYRAGPERFVMGGAINDGGSLFDWLRNSLRLPAVDAADEAVAALEPDGHGLTILPLWAGERSPGWAANARGAIVGLRLSTSPLEIQRAAMEAIALYLARIDGIMRRVVPEASQVVATGGALLNSPAWLQILADVLGQPVAVSAEVEASSRGAALLALEALDALPDGLEAIAPPIGRVYEPVPAHTARYRQAAARQARLYELLIEGQS